MDFARKHPGYTILLAFLLYSVGVCFIAEEKPQHILGETTIVPRKEYVYTDSEGEEHESKTLIEMRGIGKIITFKDIYLSAVSLMIPILIVGRITLGNSNELQHLLFGFCIIGVFLVWVSTKHNTLSVILYWLCIMTLSLLNNNDKK